MKIKKYLNGKIMDYEQKYNKLVEAVKVLQETNPSDEGIQNWVNDNVPELAEPQGEKVRKWIYNYFRSCFPTWIHPDITCGEILDWLEKQGEQKSVNYDCNEDERIRKWLINLLCEMQYHHCDDEREMGNKALAWLEKQGTSYTKRDVDDAYVEGMAFAKDELEKQKSWSEEDTFKVQGICKYLNEAKKYYADITEVRDCIDWLKSLKGKVQPKQEWTEDDDEEFDIAINALKGAGEYDSATWLITIKQRYTWKPSKEQMRALHDMNLTGNISYAGQGQTLIELYNDLKKLKGE